MSGLVTVLDTIKIIINRGDKVNRIKVLTYNISFQATTGVNKRGVDGTKCLISNDNVCIANISKLIDENGKLDFMAIQEASNWNTVLKGFSGYEYDRCHFKPGVEDIVTLWDKSKYQLDKGVNSICSYMEDYGRPFQILFFKGGLAFINLHAGHNGDIYKFNEYVLDTLENKRSRVKINDEIRRITIKEEEEALSKLRDYDIIVAGDFNSDFDNKQPELLGRQFYGLEDKKTCCDEHLVGKLSKEENLDHILYTKPTISCRVVEPIELASDHCPVVAEIDR